MPLCTQLDNAVYLVAEKAALRLIARAEQNTAGLERKLEQRKYSPDIIHHVISRLTELDLINDTRFAQLWLKQRISLGGKGPRLLLAALQKRGISKKTAQDALDTVLTEEAERALLLRCLEKAKKMTKSAAEQRCIEEKPFIRRFLKDQGFSAASIEEYFDK